MLPNKPIVPTAPTVPKELPLALRRHIGSPLDSLEWARCENNSQATGDVRREYDDSKANGGEVR